MPSCKHIPRSCRKSHPRSKRPSNCKKADGTAGRYVRAHSRPKGCTDRAVTTLQKHARGRAERKRYTKTRDSVIRATTKRSSPVDPGHPYFTVTKDAHPTVREALELAGSTPIPSIVRSRFNHTLGAPVNNKKNKTDLLAFPYGTGKESKHFLPVLFWTAYLNASDYVQTGVDYLDFHKETFQTYYEVSNWEKAAGEDVIELSAFVMHLLRHLRLKKPDDSWPKFYTYVASYMTEKQKDAEARIPLTYHATDDVTRYAIGVYVYTVSLAMKAASTK